MTRVQDKLYITRVQDKLYIISDRININIIFSLLYQLNKETIFLVNIYNSCKSSL